MAPSRGLTLCLQPRLEHFICRRCQFRSISTAIPRQSGHNRWSKIKHDKAKVDAGKNKQRSIFAKEIANASKTFGPDLNTNGRLADIITKAKREGFPKHSIEAAIARGQGKSTSGAALESVTIEALMPNNVAMIVECETDSRLRTLQEVRHMIRNSGGSISPCSYLFEKHGKITFEAKAGLTSDELLEPALDAGAVDVVDGEDGRIVVCTAPEDTKAVGEALAGNLKLDIVTSEIIWEPNSDTKVELSDSNSATTLVNLVDELQENEHSLQYVAMNIAQGRLGEDLWNELQARLVT